MKPTSSKRTALNLEAVQEASSPPVYRRGVQYYRRKKVLKYEEGDDASHIEALVIGSEPQPYKVSVDIESAEKFKAVCSCPYFEEVCKHSVAVLLTHIARTFPGVRFDMGDDGRRESIHDQPPRAREILDDPKEIQAALNEKKPRKNEFTLGVLVLEKPLALILGTLPQEVQGKVNILKVPAAILPTLEPNSRIEKLVKYLTSLPITTKGIAGGHRIPRGEEGIVLGHTALCADLRSAADGRDMKFNESPVKPRITISETENGELSIRLKAVGDDGEVLPDPVFFLGQPSWVLSDHVFYPIDLSAIHRLFQYFDSRGSMTVKLETVPKFLAVDLPILKKRMEVELDESYAPFPVAITEPPTPVIKLTEKRSVRAGAAPAASNVPAELELILGFKYGLLVLPSRDETSAVESEVYTRTISEKNGQSVWVKRLWAEEGQLRRFLSNLQPTRVLADRFFFHEEPALDALYYLSSEQCGDWETTGWDNLQSYKVIPKPVHLKAVLSLRKDTYKFEFDLQAPKEDGSAVPFPEVIATVFRNRNYLKLESGEYVRLPVATLLSVLKQIGQSKEAARPLYQALPIAHVLETHGIELQADEGFKEFIYKLRNFKELEPIPVPSSFEGELREYQKEGYNWLAFLREYGLAGILADDMGLGKTIQALALLLFHHKNHKDRKPSLVVAPTSVVYNWLSEAEKFAPQLNTALYLGRERSELLNKLKKDKGKPDVVFTTYGIIRRDYETLKDVQFDYVILDEAQNIKNPESVGAVACKSLKALHRLALSGTPVENRLKELWSIFDFLMPDFLGTLREFNETFERPIEAGVIDAGTKLRKIVHPFILRRLKSQVEKELPERTDIINVCEMEEEQRSLYLDVLDECRQKVFGEIASRGIGRSQISVLAALLRLRQVCCDPRLLKNREGDVPASSKLIALMEMLEDVIESGHKILVFSQFVEMLTLIRAELDKSPYKYEYIDGQTPAKDRLDKVNHFNETSEKELPIFLISLKAGGTGLNLTGADYVIHYDPWWNPAVENQATDRAHRIGQTRHVFNYKLITRGTVEEKILALQKKKKELADLIIGGDESVAKELTREDLEFLFSF
ncbi:MAG TPA: SNF2-related protein [Candidatus Obscuribacterales bacterium]